MKLAKTCIIIPIYNEIPTENEILSIKRNISVLNNYDIYAVHPASMSIDSYSGYGFKSFLPFDDKYFISNKSYSRLILSENFYKPFYDYEYMLIAQTDTYILNTDYSLEDFVSDDFDYYGAPWPDGPFDKPYGIREFLKILFVHHPKNLYVGNGGFSLRKISACESLVKRKSFYLKYLWKFNEDLFFSYFLKNKPSKERASQFALETNMQEEIEKGNLPYALHAFEKHLSYPITDIQNL